MPPLPRIARAWLLSWLFLTLGFFTAVHAAFDPVAETEKLLATLPAAARAKSDAYFEGGCWLQVWDLAVTLVVLWGLLKFGVTVRLRHLAERFSKNRFLQGMLFIALFTIVVTVLTLPWAYYEGFVREHQYGLSNLDPAGWLGEQVKALFVSTLLFGLVGPVLYLGIRKWPQGWWVKASLVTPFLLVFLMVLAPVFVAPLFNQYKPLTDARVRDPILSMARANGVPVDNVYQFDASKQSNRVSANVSGAFNIIRVSLNDNLLNRCSPAEVQAVMGHELGHYVLNHGYKAVVFISVVVGAGLWFTHWFFTAASRRFGPARGLRGIDDLASLPLLLIGFSVFSFLTTPVSNTIIRTQEVEADIFGLNAARQPDGFATTALKLSEYRKLAPGKWEEIFFFDHPSGYQRILMAMRWKAEHLAEPPPAPPAGK